MLTWTFLLLNLHLKITGLFSNIVMLLSRLTLNLGSVNKRKKKNIKKCNCQLSFKRSHPFTSRKTSRPGMWPFEDVWHLFSKQNRRFSAGEWGTQKEAWDRKRKLKCRLLLIMLYKVILPSKFVDETLVLSHSKLLSSTFFRFITLCKALLLWMKRWCVTIQIEAV